MHIFYYRDKIILSIIIDNFDDDKNSCGYKYKENKRKKRNA